ncbi:MAG: hypothetical protein AAF446_11940, partial [Pseudomonadota bacterium]
RSFGLLTSEEIRFRFLHPLNELTPAYANQLSTIDYDRQFIERVQKPKADFFRGQQAEAALQGSSILGLNGSDNQAPSVVEHQCFAPRAAKVHTTKLRFVPSGFAAINRLIRSLLAHSTMMTRSIASQRNTKPNVRPIAKRTTFHRQ